MSTPKPIRLATSCSNNSGCCPVVDFDESTNTVTVYDPEVPSRGKFEMSKAEWDRLASSIVKI